MEPALGLTLWTILSFTVMVAIVVLVVWVIVKLYKGTAK